MVCLIKKKNQKKIPNKNSTPFEIPRASE